MNEDIKVLVSQFIDDYCLPRVYCVYEIFKDYFGDNNVDLQNVITKEDIQNFLEKEFVEYYIPTLILNDPEVGNDCRNHNLMELPKEKIIRILELLKLPEYKINISKMLIRCGTYNYSSSISYIIVRFPSVKITNEHDRSITIEGLYVKVPVNVNGILADDFTLNRSQYTLVQYIENYMHSHVASIPKTEPSMFQHCCLGSGPIRATIRSLSCDCDENLWKLFCLELDKYVHTESLNGGPYHRLESVGYSNHKLQYGSPYFPIVNNCPNLKITSIEKEFVRYLIEKRILKFSYIGNSYTLGMNQFDLLLLISNIFIEWYNTIFIKDTTKEKVESCKYYTPTFLENGKFLVNYTIHNKCLYIKEDNDNAEDTLETIKYRIGKQVLVFKGNPVCLNITGLEDNKETYNNTVTLINPIIVSRWLCKILKVLNYRYGRDNTEFNKKIKYL